MPQSQEWKQSPRDEAPRMICLSTSQFKLCRFQNPPTSLIRATFWNLQQAQTPREYYSSLMTVPNFNVLPNNSTQVTAGVADVQHQLFHNQESKMIKYVRLGCFTLSMDVSPSNEKRTYAMYNITNVKRFSTK